MFVGGNLAMASPPPARSPVSPEESDLLRRLRARDEAAFGELIDRHHGALLRVAQLFVSSRAIAEEVVQDTWLAAFDGIDEFEGRATIKTWLFRIVANRARTRGVKESRSVPFSAMTDIDAPFEPAVDPSRFAPSGRWSAPPQRWDDDTPEKRLLSRETLGKLEVALLALPENLRAVVMLRDVEGVDADAVCEILAISDANQRVLLHRARARLRSLLEQYVGVSPQGTKP